MQTAVEFVDAGLEGDQRSLHLRRQRRVLVLLLQPVDALLQRLVAAPQFGDLIEARSNLLDAILQHLQGAHQVVDLLLLLHRRSGLGDAQLLEKGFVALRNVVRLGHVLLPLLLELLLLVLLLLQQPHATNQLRDALGVKEGEGSCQKGDTDDVRLDEGRLVQELRIIVRNDIIAHFQHEQVGILLAQGLRRQEASMKVRQCPPAAIRQCCCTPS